MATKKTTTKTEVKTPVAEVKTAAAEVKAPVAEAKAPAKKEAVKKTPAKKAAPAKKEATKKAAPAKKAPAKKTEEKDLATLLREKVAKKDVSKVDEKIAIEIKAYNGDEDYYMYILIDNGTVAVEPYQYDDKDIRIDMPVADVKAVIDGKYDFKAKALSGDFYATGSLTKLLKVKEALF